MRKLIDEPGGFGFQAGTDSLSHNDLKEAYSDHRRYGCALRRMQASMTAHGDRNKRAKKIMAILKMII